MKIPKIEYEIYYPLYNSTNLTKLNLSFCKGSKIEISIAIKINDKIDKYNLIIIMIYVQKLLQKME